MVGKIGEAEQYWGHEKSLASEALTVRERTFRSEHTDIKYHFRGLGPWTMGRDERTEGKRGREMGS